MHFVNMNQFYQDVRAWEKQLPEFDAVCGIPRSGIMVASMISMLRNIRLICYEALLNDPAMAIVNAPIRANNPLLRKPHGNRILLVDDSSSPNAVTMTLAKTKLEGHTDIFYGAVYGSPDSKVLDFCYKTIPLPRMFEWNFFRHHSLNYCLLDLDGVICEDYVNERPETDKDPAFYRHLEEAKPLYLPAYKVKGIVTSRLERYRKETEAWLERHGVEYGFLSMNPSSSPEERRMLCNHAEYKAKVYAAEPEAMLFIESSLRQAQAIKLKTKRPVLCIETMNLV